ncbi:hypothetical protein D3C86_1884040 [compost metagenome]
MLDLQIASPVVLVIIAAVGIHTMDAAAALGVPAIDTRRETPVIGSHGGLAEEGQQAGGNQSLFHHIVPLWTGKAIILPGEQGIPRVKS